MNLCIITYAYPGKHNTSDFAFVKQLVDAIAKLDNNCYVIAPYNINHYKRFSHVREGYMIGNNKVEVLRPWYFSFSNSSFLKKCSTKSRKHALKKAFAMLPVKPDVIYGHFWSSAYEGFDYARRNNIPLFVATGESEVGKMFSPKSDQKEFGDYVSGVICVSSKNRDESIALDLTTAEKCKVFPNAINSELFKEIGKKQCREELGLPQDVFIVAFLGWFNERKGPLRLCKALKQIKGAPVFSIFIGKGEQNPDIENIVFKGALPHEKVPMYLNAADAFVLPTLHEGCCNAVVEAMACGLPIISSNLPFNWDVLNDSNSIMVSPNNIDEITDAIVTLRDNVKKRNALSQGALEMAKTLTIEQRAKGIVEFIKFKINN